MAKIKVTRGGCGIEYTDVNGNARHALKTPENGPFECDDAQAARLVELGVAAYVNELGWQQVAEDPAPQPDAQQGDTDDSQETECEAVPLSEILARETVAQLKARAEDRGINVIKCKTKADYIAAIVAVEGELGDEVDPDEDDPDNELPELGAADPE